MSDEENRKRAAEVAKLHEEHPETVSHSPFCHQHPSNKGPAQVSTPTYRENYDAIFGRVPVGQA